MEETRKDGLIADLKEVNAKIRRFEVKNTKKSKKVGKAVLPARPVEFGDGSSCEPNPHSWKNHPTFIEAVEEFDDGWKTFDDHVFSTVKDEDGEPVIREDGLAEREIDNKKIVTVVEALNLPNKFWFWYVRNLVRREELKEEIAIEEELGEDVEDNSSSPKTSIDDYAMEDSIDPEDIQIKIEEMYYEEEGK